ncbi:methyltransferase domain-containing protein [Embleya sp. NPDC059237]|uniref:methyltransferase domain-containing protein n=1 Tax=Embleya sp. NPDC059237 TaxID=3346784 RepID=UPI0036C45110
MTTHPHPDTTPTAPPPDTDETRSLRHAMVASMTLDGIRPEIVDAFRAEPRHVYVPRFVRRIETSPGTWETRVFTPDHPDWAREVYTDQLLITATMFGDDGPPLSSSTVPSLMAAMLDALAVEPGMSVLEVGAGTGYNAGLLAHLTGDTDITTIDIEPDVATAARDALTAAGHPGVSVVHTDGNRPPAEPRSVDRLIATCGADHVPPAWLAAVRPGGRLVAPVGTGIAALTLDEHGHAEGPFLATPAYFMGLRTTAGTNTIPYPGDPTGPLEPCAMPLAAWHDDDLRFAIALALPASDLGQRDLPDTLTPWTTDGSVATIHADGTCRQSGPRHLAHELAHIHHDFENAGRPQRRHHRLRIDTRGHHTTTFTLTI